MGNKKAVQVRRQKPSVLMPKEVWKPNKGSQATAFDLDAKEILYWGDRGPGKTSWQIARALSRFFIGYGKFYKVLLMGMRVKSLAECAVEVETILSKLEAKTGHKCRRRSKEGDWRWESPLGEVFRIINLKGLDQAEDMIGQQYNVQCWNELCHYPSPRLYIMLTGSARSVFDPKENTPKNPDGSYATPNGKPLPKCPEEILSTTNTRGKGKLWVRKKFIEGTRLEGGSEFDLRSHVAEHEVRGKIIKLKTQAIQGLQSENPKLTPEYIAMLREQTKYDPALRREWCEGGDWYTPSGGAFDHLWDADKHVVLGKMQFLDNWFHSISVSFSSSLPTCVLWSAETDIENRVGRYSFAPGSVVFYHELYLCDEGDPHIGKKVSIRTLAKMINEESKKLVDERIAPEVVLDGFGSKNLFTPIAGGELADKLSDYGVYLDRVDPTFTERKQVREAGLALVRERLSASADNEEDGIYFNEQCSHSIRTLPDLPVDEDDPTVVDEEGEYYCYEAVRLRAMSMSAPVEDFNFAFS